MSRRRSEAMLLAAGGNLPPINKPSVAVDDNTEAAGDDSMQSGQPMEPTAARTPAKARVAGDSISTPTTTTRRAILQSSPTVDHPVADLPAELVYLANAFEAMLTGRGLLKRRGEKVTFSSLVPVVERTTGKMFKLQHLQQMKTVWPEAFQWQYIRAPSLQDHTKLEFQLLLVFEGQGGAAASLEDSASGRVQDAAARAEFKRKLSAWLEEQQQQQQGGGDGGPVLERAASNTGSDATAGSSGTTTTSSISVPCASLPPRENAPRIGGSPTLSRGMSMGANMPGYSPASNLRMPGSARPPASPTVAARVPASPTAHGPRAGHPGSVSRHTTSILEGLTSHQPGLKPGMSPVAPTPTSRLKRRPSDVEQEAGPGATSPNAAPSARGEPRRRLQLGQSPDVKQPPQAQHLGHANSLGQAASDQFLNRVQSSGVNEGQTADDLNLNDEDSKYADLSPASRARMAASSPTPTKTKRPPLYPLQLSQQMKAEGGEVDKGGAGVEGTPTRSMQSSGPAAATPSSGRPKNRLLARLMSEEVMQELRRNAESAPLASEQAAASKQLHVTSLLPIAMDLVRALFGPKGPLVKPWDEVVELMRQKSSLGSGMSSEEARLALDMLTQHVPEYVQKEVQGGVDMLRISRTIDLKTVRDKLKGIAATARANITATLGPGLTA